MFLKTFILVFFGFFSLFSKDLEKCQEVRLSDIGWTDISATTNLVALVLESLGYEPKIKVLSVPVTLQGLKNNDLDVFLGNWIPSQKKDIEPFLKEGSIVQLKQNLFGAKYTLCVPKYAYDEGLKDFEDIYRFKDKLDSKIYGIGAGNEGNGFISKMIETNDFNLKDFQLIASSEQGMLVELDQAYKEKRFIVFLGWTPHPMNFKYDIKFLSGGDNYFGPNYGEAKVYTIVRKDLEKDCPNLALFFKNVLFDIKIEEEMMVDILDNKFSARTAALNVLKKYPKDIEKWLNNVTSFDGKKAQIKSFSMEKLFEHKINIGLFAEKVIFYITNKFSIYFRFFSSNLENFLEKVFFYLLKIPVFIFILFFALFSFLIRRSYVFTLFLILGFLLIDNLGYFNPMLKSLVLVLLSTFICVILGVPLGILSNRYKRFYDVLRPILDMMQTIPTFVFLLPTLMLFGLGIVPGLISTIIFAISAPIRFTYLGLSQVPSELLEASESFGANFFERLFKVEIPFAMPSILAGVTQCIMLSLSMVVIAALVGAEGLGEPVIVALNTVNIAQGIESGLCIVILAIILDRLLRVSNGYYKNC